MPAPGRIKAQVLEECHSNFQLAAAGTSRLLKQNRSSLISVLSCERICGFFRHCRRCCIRSRGKERLDYFCIAAVDGGSRPHQRGQALTVTQVHSRSTNQQQPHKIRVTVFTCHHQYSGHRREQFLWITRVHTGTSINQEAHHCHISL